MGRGADDSPREWILEVENAQVDGRVTACSLPLFLDEESGCSEKASAISKITQPVGGKARMRTQGPKTLSSEFFSLHNSHFSEAKVTLTIFEKSSKTRHLRWC